MNLFEKPTPLFSKSAFYSKNHDQEDYEEEEWKN